MLTHHILAAGSLITGRCIPTRRTMTTLRPTSCSLSACVTNLTVGRLVFMNRPFQPSLGCVRQVSGWALGSSPSQPSRPMSQGRGRGNQSSSGSSAHEPASRTLGATSSVSQLQCAEGSQAPSQRSSASGYLMASTWCPRTISMTCSPVLVPSQRHGISGVVGYQFRSSLNSRDKLDRHSRPGRLDAYRQEDRGGHRDLLGGVLAKSQAAAMAGLLEEARAHQLRYTAELYRDANLVARIDAAMAAWKGKQ